MSPSIDQSTNDRTPVGRGSNEGSPDETVDGMHGAPVCASTPLVKQNGHDVLDNKTCDNNNETLNGNISETVTLVSESVHSMDVLSGGESDAGDTLSRRNNNSISSTLLGTLREGVTEVPRRRNQDITYFVAKELLMTERTYKRDLELVTVKWSGCVSELAASGAEAGAALARACLALEPLALACGKLLARLDRLFAAARPDDTEEPEYKKIGDILYEHLSSTADAYMWYSSVAGSVVGVVESVRRRGGAARIAATQFECRAPLSLAALLLRPLHRALHYRTLAIEVHKASQSPTTAAALELAQRAATVAREQLRHGENHAALCHMQREIAGFDKLLVAEREFIRMGCVYKHSSRGLQQRMLFLFSDILVVCSRAGSSQFRALAAFALRSLQLARADLPHSLVLTGDDVHLLLSASNECEFSGWCSALQLAIDAARDTDTLVDTELTPYEQEIETMGSSGGSLSGVCWHRVTAVGRDQLHRAMRTQLSGYLLRKFKKSPGWQKLWVVFAVFTLFFYKSWQDEAPLASLPLLGYNVCTPTTEDGIDKDFVFKLQFKNHVYFFRADSQYTFNRWTEVLQSAMIRSDSH